MQRQQQEQHQPSDRSPDRLQQAAESQCKASVSQWTEAAAGSLPDETQQCIQRVTWCTARIAA